MADTGWTMHNRHLLGRDDIWRRCFEQADDYFGRPTEPKMVQFRDNQALRRYADVNLPEL